MRKIMEGNDKHEQHVIRTIVWGGKHLTLNLLRKEMLWAA
jgi:hypothetical protein